MEQELMNMILIAIGCAPVVSGITEAIKRNTKLAGLGVIIVALLVGVTLFLAVAMIVGYPLAQSALLGLLTGFASVGAFEGFKKTKGE